MRDVIRQYDALQGARNVQPSNECIDRNLFDRRTMIVVDRMQFIPFTILSKNSIEASLDRGLDR